MFTGSRAKAIAPGRHIGRFGGALSGTHHKGTHDKGTHRAQSQRNSALGKGAAGLLALLLLVSGCHRGGPTTNRTAEGPAGVDSVAANTNAQGEQVKATPLGPPLAIATPLGLPPVPMPADNPPTARTIALGKRLYFDKRLSSDNTIACATCHDPSKGFADGRAVSTGVAGKQGTRSAPTTLNALFSPVQFWDGRAASLEAQAAGPIANPSEMNLPHALCVEKLSADGELTAAFNEAFGPGGITLLRMQRAIAAFERTLVSGNSAFDRFYFAKQPAALSEAAQRGWKLFRDPLQANCIACHLVGANQATFTDGLFHNLGTGMNSEGELTDLGRYNQTKRPADRGAFKTPTLRNIALTAPYMHDGRLKTLRHVVDFYVGGGNSNPDLDKLIKPLALTGRDRDDLVAFLESLTGELPAIATP